MFFLNYFFLPKFYPLNRKIPLFSSLALPKLGHQSNLNQKKEVVGLVLTRIQEKQRPMPTTRMTAVFKSFVGTTTSIMTQYAITMTSFSTLRSRCCRSPKDPLLVTYDTEERMNLRNQRSYFRCDDNELIFKFWRRHTEVDL